MRVSAVGLVHCPFIVNKGVGRDVLVYHECWNADSETCEIVGEVVTFTVATESYAVFGSWDIDGWFDVVGETAMFVKVDDEKCLIPVLTLADRIVDVLDQRFAGRHVGEWMHGINCAALGIDPREGGKGASFDVFVEFVGVDEFVFCVVLDPFVHPAVNNVYHKSATILHHQTTWC